MNETMHSDYPLLVTLGALLILSPVVKSLLERFRLPALVGYIALGFLVSLFNYHWPFITPAFDSACYVLAELGVVALLFRVGLKSHTRALLRKLPDASLIWSADVLVNLGCGFVVARYLLELPLEAALVIATALSATSIAVSVAVWDESHKLDTSTGQLLVDVAELDDLSGVLLLAILLAIMPGLQGNETALFASIGTTTLAVLLKLALFVSGCYLFAHYLEPGFTHFSRRWESSTTALTITVLGAGLVIAALAGYLGFPLAIGALFAGLAFSRDPQATGTDARFAYFSEFLTPFFFIYIGMQTDPGAVMPSLGLAAVLLVPAVLGKLLGVTTPALGIVKVPAAILLSVSMIPRAEIAMIIVYQFHQRSSGIITDRVFAALVLVSVLTSIAAPLALRALLERQSRV